MGKFAVSLIAWLCLPGVALATGCGKDEPAKGHTRAAVRPVYNPMPSAAALLTAGLIGSAPASSKEGNEPIEQGVGSARERRDAQRIGLRRVVLDELVDVGPAGPSAATAGGVLLLTRDGRSLFARLAPGGSKSAIPEKTPVAPLTVNANELIALERGPAVSAGYVYFIHGGHLVRQQLPSGAVEDLASDARLYTRVAVPDLPIAGAPAIAGYVARHPTEKSTLIAKLWVEGQGTHTLTPDGSAANSVAMARAGQGYITMSLESRTGMSPLHARKVTFDAGKVRLLSDVVPWVAGTAQPLTEVYAIGDPSSVWALLPMERDATRFGLARITIGLTPRMGAEVHWRDYPNGIEPAVVTSGYLCDRPVVMYARPATAEPHATQELHLASIGTDGLGASTIVATSRAFADASLATLDGGALVVYVADRRTWARRLRCLP